MEHIKTIETVRLHTGNLELTEVQASVRRHLLTPVEGKRGVYAIKDTVTFKAGEVFGYDGEIKAISNRVVDAKTEKLMSEVLLERKKARVAEAKADETKAKKDAKDEHRKQ